MASIERVKTKLGKKTIIKTPVRYAYFQPEYTRKEGKDKHGNNKFVYDKLTKLAPLLVDLKTGEAVEDKSLEGLAHKDAPYCPIASNSKDNPVKLNYSNRLRYFTAIEYISILEYKDTGNTVFTFLQRKTCWIRADGRVFHKEKVMIKLNIRKGGKTTITRNGVLCITNASITNALHIIMPLMRVKYIARYRGRVVLKKMFIKHFLGLDKMSAADFDRLSYSQLSQIYRVKQNPKLKDLPWNEEQLASIYRSAISLSEHGSTHVKQGERSVANVKVSLNRYLRRGDTKQAIEACFYGFAYPKSIKRVMLKTEPLEFEFESYKNIFDAVELLGVDNTRNLITNRDGSPNKDMIANPHYMEMLGLGFKLNQVSTFGRSYMRDILRMQSRLLEADYVLEFMPNMRDYHDYLMRQIFDLDRDRNRIRAIQNAKERLAQEERIALQIQKRKRLAIGYSAVDTSEQFERFEKDNYIFRSPTLANELVKVGKDLNICVSIYMEDFFLKKLDIVLVTKLNQQGGEKYIACLEVRRRSLVQAKLNSNSPVNSNGVVFKAVKAWASDRGIALACRDVGIQGSRYVEYKVADKDRVDFLQNIVLEVD